MALNRKSPYTNTVFFLEASKQVPPSSSRHFPEESNHWPRSIAMCVLGSSSWWGRRDRVHSVRSSGRGHPISTGQETDKRNSASRLASHFLLFIQSRSPIHKMVPTTLSTDLTLNLSGNFLKPSLGNGDPWRLERCLRGSEHLLPFQGTGFQLQILQLYGSRTQRASMGACTHMHVTPPTHTHTEHRHIIHAHIIKTKAGQKRRLSG